MSKNKFKKNAEAVGEAPAAPENNIANSFKKDEAERKLPEAVDKAYKCIHVQPGVVVFNRISVDLRTITLEDAADLVEAGFPYLVKRDSKTPDPKTSN